MVIAIIFRRPPVFRLGEGFIPEITVKELLARDLDDLVIERPCLEIIQNSEVIDQIQIINGLKEGNITRALNGEHAERSSGSPERIIEFVSLACLQQEFHMKTHTDYVQSVAHIVLSPQVLNF
jgi:hypothetical protein